MGLYEQLVKEIGDRWATLEEQIEKKCEEIGRSKPTVIAVSKQKSLEHVLAAYDVGIKDFGENYVQELETKVTGTGLPNANWHFIGHLQRRNAKKATLHADVIHSLDNERIIQRVGDLGYEKPVLLQYNISKEGSKFGVTTLDELERLYTMAKELRLAVQGLMVIGDPNWDEKTLREKFLEGWRISSQLVGHDAWYSAGMTHDWPYALEANATHLRIGTAIFGERNSHSRSFFAFSGSQG